MQLSNICNYPICNEQYNFPIEWLELVSGFWSSMRLSNICNYPICNWVIRSVLELSLIWSHLLWGKFSAFSGANAIHNFSTFCSTKYPSLLGGQSQCGMRSLPDTSTHDQQWELNPRPDLESDALSTWPHAIKIRLDCTNAGIKCIKVTRMFCNICGHMRDAVVNRVIEICWEDLMGECRQ